jgi:predicted  nucleic acid-binding Zn-ribbon protein
MPLICTNCRTINQDPGGDPRIYHCGHCGQATLQRTPTLTDTEKNRLAAAIAGASILGLATENPVGALIGALLGYALGDRLLRGRKP